jgi:uncharacterized protein (TIGR02453 family)
MPGPKSTEPTLAPELYRFLRELVRNNNREWFQKNKARYDQVVREPCLAFIREVGPGIARLSKWLVADDRPNGGSLYRIYRDVRLSKDKSPYKTTVGIHFYHMGMGKSSGSYPGFYLHLGPDDNFVGAGLWGPDPAALLKIRKAIATQATAWKKVRVVALSDYGDSLKRVPTGFDPEHPFAEDLKHKDFTASLPLTEAQVMNPRFTKTFLDGCRKLDPFNRFLAQAVGVDF